MTEYIDLFEANIKRNRDEYGYCVNCRKGLWGVLAPTKEEAEREARRYFAQYFSDGEYDTEQAQHRLEETP